MYAKSDGFQAMAKEEEEEKEVEVDEGDQNWGLSRNGASDFFESSKNYEVYDGDANENE